jgi:lipoprotein-anchoring transpeptidase ErfK/SrfK
MLRSARRRLFLTALTTVAAACAGAATSGGSAPRRDSTVITAEDMTKVQATNLYDVVRRLHPEWLNQRTAATVGSLNSAAPAQPVDVQVFVDSQHIGTSETLKQLTISTTTSLKYYTAAEAQTRFGAGNLNGVIQVIMTKP